MKYIKKYNSFNEALKPSQFRKYVKAFNKERYADIFKQIGDDYEHDRNYYRVYIPLKKEKQTGYLSDTHQKIEKFLNDNGIEIVDYIEGTAKYKSEGLSKKNDEIENSQIRLVGNNFGEISQVMGKTVQTGIFSKEEALDIANKMNLYLVETSNKGGVSICKIVDYNKFLEEQAKELRTVKIGQILQRLKNDELSRLFTSDEKRKSIVSTEDEELMVVISRHPYDIAGSDTDRDWTNCMTIGTDKSNRLTSLMDELETAKSKNDEKKIDELERKIYGYKRNGMNVKYLIHEVKEGSLISYLIKASDKNIESPLAVLNIKPFNSKNNIILSSSKNMYGVYRSEFKNKVDDILDEYFNKDVKGGIFKINKKIYDDNDSYVTRFDGLNEVEILDLLRIKNYKLNDDGTIDVNGDVDLSQINISKLPLKFGRVTGSFDCSENKLVSLEGSPIFVGVDFKCDNNQLTTMDHCPTKVGRDIWCYYNKLKSLEGCPTEVSGNFFCGNNQISSLKGCPTKVGGNFACSYNLLTSLVGCPSEVGGGDFSCNDNLLTILDGISKGVKKLNCDNNQLVSLIGCTSKIKKISCKNNKLTSLKGSPKILEDFDCSYNQLTTLEDGPVKVTGRSPDGYYCNNNQLTSLKGAPNYTRKFICSNNLLTTLKDLPKDMEVSFFVCDDNQLTSLEGSPKSVDDFYCKNNQLTTLKGGPESVKYTYIVRGNKINKEEIKEFQLKGSYGEILY